MTFEVVLDNSKMFANCLEAGSIRIQVCAFDEGPGFIHEAFVINTPTWIGSGSPRLGDDDDSSGAILSTQSHSEPTYISSNPLAAYFKAPDGFEATALAFVFRAASVAGTPQHNYQLVTRLCSYDNSIEFFSETIASAGDPVPNQLTPLLVEDGALGVTTRKGFWSGVTFDENSATEGGGWLEFAVNGISEIADALVGDGLRVDIGVFQEEDLDVSVHEIFTLSKFCLLLSGRYT